MGTTLCTLGNHRHCIIHYCLSEQLIDVYKKVANNLFDLLATFFHFIDHLK